MFDKDYLLLDETTLTANKNGDAFDVHWSTEVPQVFGLAVTGTISGTSPTLSVKIQGTNDGGSNWTDIVTFAQVTTAAKKLYVRALTPFKQIRAVATKGGTNPSYGKVQCGIVPAGEYNLPK